MHRWSINSPSIINNTKIILHKNMSVKTLSPRTINIKIIKSLLLRIYTMKSCRLNRRLKRNSKMNIWTNIWIRNNNNLSYDRRILNTKKYFPNFITQMNSWLKLSKRNPSMISKVWELTMNFQIVWRILMNNNLFQRIWITRDYKMNF